MKKNNNKIWDVIIIGGGASGMMACAVAGARGKSVLILDKNKTLGEQKYANIIPSKTFCLRHNDKGRNLKFLSLFFRAVIGLAILQISTSGCSPHMTNRANPG